MWIYLTKDEIELLVDMLAPSSTMLALNLKQRIEERVKEDSSDAGVRNEDG